VLSWRLSNTLDSDFCTEALEDALAQYLARVVFDVDDLEGIWTGHPDPPNGFVS